MDFILTRTDGDNSRDIYVTDGTLVFPELRASGWVEYPSTGTWRRFSNPVLHRASITVQVWHRCPNGRCVNDAHEGSGHVDATGRSFNA